MLIKTRSQTYNEQELEEKRKQYGIHDLFNITKYENNFKDSCVQCGNNIKEKNGFKRWDHYLKHGNFCSVCSGESNKKANLPKKESKINDNLLKRFQKISESFTEKLSTVL